MLIKYNIILAAIFIVLHFLPHLYQGKVTLLKYYFNKAFQLILIVFLYSIIKTSFITIFTYFFIPMVFMILFYKKVSPVLSIRFIPRLEEIQALLVVLLIGNSILTTQFLLISNSLASNYMNYINVDIVFYSNVSNFLNFSNIETNNINYLILNDLAPNIYHYFELWLNAFLTKIFSINSLESMILLTYTILKTLVVFGVMVFINSDKVTIRSLFASIFVLFFTGIYIPELYNGTFFDVMRNINWAGWSHPKLLPIYFISTLFMVTFKSFNNKNYALLVLSFLPIIYATTLFGYIGLVIGIIVYKIYFKEKLFLPIIILTLPILFFQFFYSYFGENVNTTLPQSISVEYINNIIHIIGGTIIFLFILYLPFILIFSQNIFLESKYFFRKENIRYVFYTLILLLSVLSATLGWGLIHQKVDSGQLFSNYLVFVQVIVFLLAYKFLSSLKLIFLSIFIIFNIVFNFKLYNFTKTDNIKENIQNLNKIVKEKRNGAILFTKEHYMHPFNQYTLTNLPFLEFFLIDNNFRFTDMSIFEIDFSTMKNTSIQNDCLRVQVQNSLFMMKKNKNKGDIKLDFIKNNKIDFLMYPKNYPISDKVLKLFYKKTFYRNWIILTKEI